jgi:hypothetical protein
MNRFVALQQNSRPSADASHASKDSGDGSAKTKPGNDKTSTSTSTGPTRPGNGRNFIHGIAKNILESVSSRDSSSNNLEAQLELLETEILTRQHQFGMELYDIMDENLKAGSGTGGEDEPRVVEIFADAHTDIRFLRKKIQHQQDHLENIDELGRKEGTNTTSLSCSSTVTDNENNDPSASGIYNDYESKQPSAPAWAPGWSRWIRTTGKAKPTIKEEKAETIRQELADLSNAITDRKRAFGSEMYPAMVSLGEDYKPSLPLVGDMLEATKRDIARLQDKMQDTKMVLQSSGSAISHSVLQEFVNEHPSAWAMLSVNCLLPEKRCQEIVFRVALEFVTGRTGHDALDAVITKSSFHSFQRFLSDPKGHQEFFQRSVFMAFDEDWNGILDREETDQFLDTFYRSGSIFEGDARLPVKREDLKATLLRQRKTKNDESHSRMEGDCKNQNDDEDVGFTLNEIRSLISGFGIDPS